MVQAAIPAAESRPEGAHVKEKKRRTTNPGVRVQGGRIYDSESGTTCHQCRQKTVEVKAKCTDCTLYWCPRCLTNRYGEVVEEVARLAKWPCPRCRDVCNCSNCRKRRGLEATGILSNVCKAAGIGSVSELLTKNPNAKRSALPAPDAKALKPAKAAKQQKKEAESPGYLVPDDELGKRLAPFPEGRLIRVFKPGPRAQRRRGVAWPDGLGASMRIPDECSAGDLVEVVEFVQVFGSDIGLEVGSLASFAAELVQPAADSSAFADEGLSPTGRAHQCLLDLVRSDWGLKGTVGIPGWQSTMRQYLKQDRVEAAATSGASAPRAPNVEEEAPTQDPEMQHTGGGQGSGPAADADNSQDPLAQYPDGGYWRLAPGIRLRMLRALCHDALSTAVIRDRMEAAMEQSAAANKEKREEEAAARREVRQARQEERNRQIALLIAGGNASALTIEEQRAVMDTAKAKVESEAVGGHPEAGSAEPEHPVMRTVPLGQDREGRLFWKLQSSAVFAGGEGAIYFAKPWNSVEADEWRAHSDIAAVICSLDPRGRSEGLLRQRMCKAFAVSADAFERKTDPLAIADKTGSRTSEAGTEPKGRARGGRSNLRAKV